MKWGCWALGITSIVAAVAQHPCIALPYTAEAYAIGFLVIYGLLEIRDAIKEGKNDEA
jgi:hypothetical protein